MLTKWHNVGVCSQRWVQVSDLLPASIYAIPIAWQGRVHRCMNPMMRSWHKDVFCIAGDVEGNPSGGPLKRSLKASSLYLFELHEPSNCNSFSPVDAFACHWVGSWLFQVMDFHLLDDESLRGPMSACCQCTTEINLDWIEKQPFLVTGHCICNIRPVKGVYWLTLLSRACEFPS